MYSNLELPSFSWLMPQTSVIVFPLNQGHRPTQLDFLAIVSLNWEPSNKNYKLHPHQKTYCCHQCVYRLPVYWILIFLPPKPLYHALDNILCAASTVHAAIIIQQHQ